MKKLSGKIVEARATKTSSSELRVGSRLRELRKLSGMTQKQLAEQLSIGQTALSKLEQRDDIHISTLKKYVEALGARLRVDANFDPRSSLVLNIKEAFDSDPFDENQLLLPIIDEEKFRSQRDVILSIKPQYSGPIQDGLKTIELRRRFPLRVPNGTIAFIYTTSPTRALTGAAEIESVSRQPIEDIWEQYAEHACVARKDFDDYFSGLSTGYAIKFLKAKAFSRPLGLSELRERFDFEPPQSFLYAKPILREALKHESSTLFD